MKRKCSSCFRSSSFRVVDKTPLSFVPLLFLPVCLRLSPRHQNSPVLLISLSLNSIDPSLYELPLIWSVRMILPHEMNTVKYDKRYKSSPSLSPCSQTRNDCQWRVSRTEASSLRFIRPPRQLPSQYYSPSSCWKARDEPNCLLLEILSRASTVY